MPSDTSSTKHDCLEEECAGTVACNSIFLKAVLDFGRRFFLVFDPPASWQSF